MKYLFALPFLLLTTNAHAEVIRKACGPEDYKRIDRALAQDEIRTGGGFRRDVESMLAEEMGPRCNLLVDLTIGNGIPGNHSTQYELIGSGGRNYVITLVSSVEENQRYVVIERAK